MKNAKLLIIFILFSANNIAQEKGNITDLRDGQYYETIKIGEQIWMASNLLFETPKGSWCYDDESRNCYKYGRLYNWETANNACPDGWRLPGKEDWVVLVKNFDKKYNKNKSSRLAYAQMIQGGASDFNALFGGLRTSVLYRPVEPYIEIDHSANFWTSSKSAGLTAWSFQLKSILTGYSSLATFNKGFGLSVRCLKN